MKKMKLPSKDCIDEIIEKQVAGKGYPYYFSSILKWEMSPSKIEEIKRGVDRLHSMFFINYKKQFKLHLVIEPIKQKEQFLIKLFSKLETTKKIL